MRPSATGVRSETTEDLPESAGDVGDAASARFLELLNEFRRDLDEDLEAFFREKRQLAGEGAIPLVEEVGRVVRSGGKRLRPALVHFTHRAFGGADSPDLRRLAMSTELLHTYLLVHDDIMDRAEVRRGVPTTQARFRRRHRDRGWPGSGEHYGTSQGILVGDLAYSWAAELFGRVRPEEGAEELRRVFAATCEEVIFGQFIELQLPYGSEPEELDLLRVLRLKSGRYSVERPMELGACLAAAPPPASGPLQEYGTAVGEAFQLQDDVLGTFGDSRAVGKPVGSDLAQGKRTLLVHHALRRASAPVRDRLLELLGSRSLGPEEVREARDIIRDAGALEVVRDMIGERLARAERALDKLALEGEPLSFFRGLIVYSRERDR